LAPQREPDNLIKMPGTAGRGGVVAFATPPGRTLEPKAGYFCRRSVWIQATGEVASGPSPVW
jgi:hypothetical protein